ncbi:MAG: methionine--tRNA ligase [archaeon]
MAKNKFYITTAIDYVNSRPHVGHAFEKVLADALARWHRLIGNDVFFLTGVDENAQKNVQAAEKAGIPVKQFIDTNAAFFIELCKKLNISYDDFIRTTAKEHAVVVKKILEKIIKNGDIYKSTYEGLYCVGCETYYSEKDLNNGKCPEHNKAPELRKEEAYFFKLSKYKKELLKLIPKYVVPKSKANEVITRINEGLDDICISRKGAKWGIDMPNDDDYKVWVWIDALINYVSGLKDKEKDYWPAQLHVVGKGINWFHSVIWPSVLISAGYKLPEKLLVHGYLNLGGQKISKSLGNVIDPVELVDKYGSDSVRYSLLRCTVFEDSDFSEQLLIDRHNNELANKLGNLVSRVAALAEKYGLEKIKDNKLLKKLDLKKIENHFKDLEIDKALIEIFSFVDACNEYIQSKKPWEADAKDRLKVLYEIADSIKAIAILLYPFIPETSEKIAKQFKFDIKYENIEKPLTNLTIKKGEILFQKIV